MLMKARSGTVFHKNPDLLLQKEKMFPASLMISVQPVVGEARFQSHLPGKSSGRALIKKEFVDNFEIGRDEKGFLEKILPKTRFYLS